MCYFSKIKLFFVTLFQDSNFEGYFKKGTSFIFGLCRLPTLRLMFTDTMTDKSKKGNIGLKLFK